MFYVSSRVFSNCQKKKGKKRKKKKKKEKSLLYTHINDFEKEGSILFVLGNISTSKAKLVTVDLCDSSCLSHCLRDYVLDIH